MAETDTSPAALRALAEYWADDKPAGVHGDDPDAIDAIVRETDAKMAETIAALQSLAGQKEALNSTLRFVWGAEIGDLVAKLADAEMRLAALAAEKEAGALAPDGAPLRFIYRNYKGEIAERTVLPRSVRFGSTEWHPEPQWLMLAYDVGKQADREFAMRDMRPVAPAPASCPLTEVGETSRGYKLYRAPNPVGGNTYWSDEIGGGVVVWDTCLVGQETLRLALAIETGAPAPDGWIPWEGGECPVDGDVYVAVILRGGFTPKPRPAMYFRWGLSDIFPDGDIIAYRLSKEG